MCTHEDPLGWLATTLCQHTSVDIDGFLQTNSGPRFRDGRRALELKQAAAHCVDKIPDHTDDVIKMTLPKYSCGMFVPVIETTCDTKLSNQPLGKCVQ